MKDFGLLTDKNVFLAISGGKDSMVLSTLLCKLGISHTLLHCNFQLRANDSELDEQFILNYAKTNSLKIHTERFDTTKTSDQLGLSIQETARNLRYNWFETFMKDENHILLTAHHQDDSIETFFINLMRGTGIQGLTGIKSKRSYILRPLSSFTSEQIHSFVIENGIAFRQDKSNFDNKYLRNNLRNELLPAFEKRSENFRSKVYKTINSLQETNSWIEKQAKQFKTENFKHNSNVISINKDIILAQETIFLEYIFQEYGIYRSNVHSFKSTICAGTGSKFLSTKFQFTVDRNHILISVIKDIEHINAVQVNSFPNTISIGDNLLEFDISSVTLSFNDNSIQQFDSDLIEFPITIRPWHHGDRIRPLGMTGSKLISDILIDKKTPLINKDGVLVIEDQSTRILAVVNLLISNEYRITEATNKILSLKHSQFTDSK